MLPGGLPHRVQHVPPNGTHTYGFVSGPIILTCVSFCPYFLSKMFFFLSVSPPYPFLPFYFEQVWETLCHHHCHVVIDLTID